MCANNVVGLTRDEVVAQGMFFLFAGYETTANTLAFLGYLLTVNSDCQEKLIEEIDTVMDGQVTHGRNRRTGNS